MTLERITFVFIIIIVAILSWHGLEWRDSAKERLYVSMGSAAVPLSDTATLGFIAVWERRQEGMENRLWSLVLGIPQQSSGMQVDIARNRAVISGQPIDTAFIETPGVYLLNADNSLDLLPIHLPALEILDSDSAGLITFLRGDTVVQLLSEARQ